MDQRAATGVEVSHQDANVRGEIVAAMQAADDPKDRAMLAMMLRFWDHVERLFADEEMLRRKVLNGDYDNHRSDHDYVMQLADANALRAVRWVNGMIERGGYCDYAKRRMAEEDERAKDIKGYWRKFVETLIQQAPAAIVYALAILFGVEMIGK